MQMVVGFQQNYIFSKIKEAD